jgi:hypothetical protein
MNRIIASTAVALSLAAPAFANDQLAASLGVEPGVYTTAELVQLKNAAEFTSNDARVFLGDSLNFTADAAATQLAASIGVEPGRYSVAELAILKNASTEEGNDARVHFDDGLAFTSNAGAVQLALALGVSPDLPLNKLIELKDAAETTSNERYVILN